MNKLLFKLSSHLPCRLIALDAGPYLERYYVGKVLGVTFYLHRFVSSDTERHLHNHPWGWGRALVLSGRYTEESVLDICPQGAPSGCLIHRADVRWWNRVNGNSFHRISNAAPGTWTLFFHGPRLDVYGNPLDGQRGAVVPKGWGFLDSADSEVTVFRPYPSARSRWWESAPKGRNVGRVPLCSGE